MVNPSLERQVLLALGWQKTARTVSPDAGGHFPPQAHSAPQAYLRSQQDRARESLEELDAQLCRLREAAADNAKIVFHKRARLVEDMGEQERPARDINAAAAPLTRQFEACLEDARTCDRLLGMIRGEVDTPTPALPLHRYQELFEKFRDAPDQAGVPHDATGAPRRTIQEGAAPIHARIAAFVMRHTDRSDRIAMSVALILSITVFALGFYYVYSWGSVVLDIQPLGEHHYQVSCVNSSWQTIMLYAPYDKQGLPRAATPNVGIALELLDDDGADITFPLEAVWYYKEQPAHLYGPIVLGPMTRAELYLNLAPYVPAEDPYVLRLTLFRAPHRRHAVYTLKNE